MNQRKRARCERALQRMELQPEKPPVKQKGESKEEFNKRLAAFNHRVEQCNLVIENTRRNLGQQYQQDRADAAWAVGGL